MRVEKATRGEAALLRFISMLAALVVAGATAATAIGDSGGARPIRVPEPLPPPIFRPAGEVCAFPVEIAALVDRVVYTIFPTDANGDTRLIITGYVVEQFTNLDTGKTFTANVTGPVFLTIHADGSFDAVFDGHSSIDLFPTDLPAGPALLLNSGRLFLEGTAQGQFILDGQTGNLEDVCALLS